MSRWTSNFESHAFNGVWKQTKDALGVIETSDPVVIAEAEELARLRKVTAYIDKALQGIDPELLPLNFWDGLRDQFAGCAKSLNAFNADKNPQHFRNANQQIDSALSQLRPHLLAKGRLGPALQTAAKAYATALESASKDLSEKALAAVAATQGSQNKAAEFLQGVEEKVGTINGKYNELLVDTEDGDATFTELQAEIDEIKAFHKRLTVGGADNPSIREDVSVAREVALKGKEAIDQLRSGAATTIEGLTNFETRILGQLKEDGQREGGLKSELDSRMIELGDVEAQQKRRYGALNEQIESLLPGATSAGLASAYNQMKKSFDVPIKKANRVFYFSISALVALSLLVNVESIGFWSIEFVHLTDWSSVGRSLTHKLPFYIPLVWLAYFSSKRRSEFQRLEQEYAHKEALAKSYDSYRTQIDELGSEGDELRRDLLAKSVDAIAFNASSSLDGKHGDKIPLQEAVEHAVAVAMKIAKGQKLDGSSA